MQSEQAGVSVLMRALIKHRIDPTLYALVKEFTGYTCILAHAMCTHRANLPVLALQHLDAHCWGSKDQELEGGCLYE